jgi:pimeloyl-ACP methyl ester carboxylesterase
MTQAPRLCVTRSSIGRIVVRTLLGCVAALAAATLGFPIATASAGTIQWHGCGPELPPNLQCGEIAVPLDYARPRGATTKLGFARLPAQDRSRRVGSLIINPGGPGAGGSSFVAIEALGRHLWHPALHRRFDLIGMDPRGTGTSAPIQCDPGTWNQIASLFPHTEAEFAQLQAHVGAMGESCLRMTGPLLGHMDTLSAARDMEALRRALGEGKLNFLGLSYGAELGTLYAERYPRRIRAMALDAILDHSISTDRIFANAAVAYEDTFNRFAAWCRRTTRCPLHGRDVAAFFDRLVRRADRQPIPAPLCATEPCRPTVTGAEIRLNSFNPLSTKRPIRAIGFPGWAGYAAALVQAESGDASAFASHLATVPNDDPFPTLGVNCVDYPKNIASFADFAAMTRRGRRLAPHTQGANEAWIGITGCMRWPVPLANPPHRARVRGAPPILLVSSTHDPSTPYVGARRILRQIPGAVLLTREGDGHTSSWLGPRSRTNAAIVNYLITRATPPPNTVYGN